MHALLSLMRGFSRRAHMLGGIGRVHGAVAQLDQTAQQNAARVSSFRTDATPTQAN